MALPSVTVISDASGVHPVAAHAWWMGDVADEIRTILVDVDDAVRRMPHALALAGPDDMVRRDHLRDAAAGLRHVREHLERARRAH